MLVVYFFSLKEASRSQLNADDSMTLPQHQAPEAVDSPYYTNLLTKPVAETPTRR